MSDLETPQLDGSTISANGLMLLGYQRTANIRRHSRMAWEAGDREPLAAEVAERGKEIFAGAVAEIWTEYQPLRLYLKQTGRVPQHVIDIGCGQAITDAFFAADFGSRLTLVDIEMTEGQYHPVSYTHLDVYKRQIGVQHCLQLRGRAGNRGADPTRIKMRRPDQIRANAAADIINCRNPVDFGLAQSQKIAVIALSLIHI